MKTVAPLALALFPIAGPAQDRPAPTTVEPHASRPLVRVQVAGPAAIRQQFLATNLGSMLTGDEAQPFANKLAALIEPMLRPLERAGLHERLIGYRGWLELEVFAAPRDGSGFDWTWALRATPDRRTDLPELAAGFAALLQRFSRAEPVPVGGDGFRRVRVFGEQLTLPKMRGEDLVVVGGSRLEEQLERAVAALDAMAQRAPKRGRSPVSLEVDLQQVAALSLSGENEREAAAAKALFGVSSLGTLGLSLRPAGPQVMIELTASFTGAERGIFGGLFPDLAGKPKLMPLIAPKSKAWKAGKLRLDEIARAAIRAVAAYLVDDRPLAERERDLATIAGFHPVDDLLGYMDGQVLVLGAYHRARDDDEWLPVRDTCWVFGVRDPDGFARGWRQFEDSLIAFVASGEEITEHQGVEIKSRASFGRDSTLHTCAVDNLVMMAFDDAGLELMKSAIERRRETEFDLPEVVKRVMHNAPPGLNGIAMADVVTVLAGHLGSLANFLEEVVAYDLRPHVQQRAIADALEPMLAQLATNHLDRIVTLTGYDAGRWTFRILW